MSRKPATNYGEAPRQRAPREAPKGRGETRTPKGHVARAPRERRAGAVPNPRKPKLVRDVAGGALKDLFAIFRDLPRPPRPKARVPLRIARGRRRH